MPRRENLTNSLSRIKLFLKQNFKSMNKLFDFKKLIGDDSILLCKIPVKFLLRGMRKQSGTIALISLLIIGAVTLAIGLSVNLLGLEEMKMGFRSNKSSESFYVAESCLEEALMRLKRESNYTGGSLAIGNKSCSIVIEANNDQRIITVSGDVNNMFRKIKAVVNIIADGVTYGLEIVSWQEIN